MQTITIINNPDGTVEAHRKGCADVTRKTRKFAHADSFEMDVTSERMAWEAYNADFIAEGGEDNAYRINFLPCCNLPKFDESEEDEAYASIVQAAINQNLAAEPEVEKPMTKTEAYEWIKRVREDLRDAEDLIYKGRATMTREMLVQSLLDASGAIGELLGAVEDTPSGDAGRGINGIKN